MRYLSIVRTSENQGPPPQALLDAMSQLIAASLKNGSMVETAGLAPTSAGVRVRIAGGRLNVTDGPFAETKEVVGGYAIIEARSRAEAIERARAFLQLHLEHWPGWQGECEVREMVYHAP